MGVLPVKYYQVRNNKAMIYLDNAATTRQKPSVVLKAYENYVTEIGVSPGRGSYSLGIQASRMLYQSRKTIGNYFGLTKPTNVVFTKNSTEAINMFLNGFLEKGDHVLISCYEHNSVLRPIHNLKNNGIIEYDVIPYEVFEHPEKLTNYIKSNTKLFAITLASNLTGEIVFNSSFAKKAKELINASIFVDASQGAGKGLINMESDGIDFLAFTGHKDLLGLPGTGGLCSKNELHFKPLIQGGTGVHGESYVNPDIYPDAYESGTLNMPAIWALKNSIEYINSNLDTINAKEKELLEYTLKELSNINSVEIYNRNATRVPTFCFNIAGQSSSDVVKTLDDYGICVRGGIHCAILAHTNIGTVETGAVRVSLNSYNTFDEIDKFVTSVRRISECI